MIRSASDLEVFKASYNIAMEVFQVSRTFPKEERYSLTDQLVRSSRSIVANVAEGWGKRNYINEFRKHLTYSLGSLEETKIWLLFARDCGYIDSDTYNLLYAKCDSIGAMLFKLSTNWKAL